MRKHLISAYAIVCVTRYSLEVKSSDAPSSTRSGSTLAPTPRHPFPVHFTQVASIGEKRATCACSKIPNTLRSSQRYVVRSTGIES